RFSGSEYAPSLQNDNTATRIYYDTSNVVTNVISNVVTPQAQSLIKTGLVDQKVNTIDPSFYDCMYSTTLGQTVIERCYKDFGCCATTCCSNEDWKNKYGWAVALIVIFCALVVIAVIIWMIVWLINRSKDKKQKRLLEDTGLSRATSNVSHSNKLQIRKNLLDFELVKSSGTVNVEMRSKKQPS
ncbi:hypothetical protein OESDEN_12401, partial [Oesophagostomum dentatum]